MFKKVVKNTAVMVLGSLMMLGQANAKDMKVGIVDIQGVISQMPEMALIQSTIEAEFKTQMEQLQKIQADAKYNLDKLQREQETMSPEQVEKLRQEIIAQQKELEEKGKPLQAAMQRRGQEEQNKVLSKVLKALDKVAKEGDYQLVLRRESIAYAADSEKKDISKKVLDTAKASK